MLDKILHVTLKRIEMKTVSSQRNKILLLEEDFKKQEKRCILRPTEVKVNSQCEESPVDKRIFNLLSTFIDTV